MPSPNATPTPITPPRVPLIDARTGLIDRAWYMFFLSLLNAATLVDDGDLGPSAESLIASYDAALQTLTQELQTQPSNQYAELLAQIDEVRQQFATVPRQELGTMAALQQANLPWVTFDTSPEGVPPDIGTVAWDGGTTLGVQATTNVLIRVGESEYVYVKASSAITKGQLCYHTGSVGASSVITVAPTPLALTDPNQIVGVAAETIALNAFGLIQISGDLRGFNTTGSSVGETWADGDPLYYNPAYVGSMTKVKPSAPNQKTYLGEVINAGAGSSGSMNIRIVPGSILGGTDSNVQFSGLANNDIIQYDSALGYWKNVTIGSAGGVTSVTGTSPVVSSGGSTPAISLATGYGDTKNPYAAKTANYVLAGPTSGAAAVPTFRALVAADIPSLPYGTGTVTSVSVTSANGFAGTVATATTTPAITMSTSITGLIYGNGTAIAATTVSAPLAYSAGTLSITQSGTSTNGYLSSTDWNTFNNKQPAGTYVTSVAVASSNGFAGTSSGGATPTLTLTTTITGLLKGNGTAISAATSGTDYAPATSGTSILYGNGAGGFSNVTIGTGVSFAGGALSATGSGGTVTSVAALTLGTTGTDLSSTVVNSTTTPVITLNVPTASATNRGALSSTDWTTFNNKQSTSAPVTYTANFSVAVTDNWIINNKSGSSCTATLPAASSYSGRVLHFQNYQAQTLISASSNVVPLAGGAAGTSILLASAGDSATLVSDGSNWLMTQYVPNNILLLE